MSADRRSLVRAMRAALADADSAKLDYFHAEASAAVAAIMDERRDQMRRGGLFVAWGITLIIATGVFGGLVRWETDARIIASAFAVAASAGVIALAIALYWPRPRPRGARGVDLGLQVKYAALELDDLKRGAIRMLVLAYLVHVRNTARDDRILVSLFRLVVVQAASIIALQIVLRAGL